MCVFCLHVYLCNICVPSTHKGQQKAPDPLELELQTIVSLYVGAGSQILWLFL